YRAYAACFFLEKLLEGEEGNEARRFLEMYEDYADSAGKKALSKRKFLDKLKQEYQERSAVLAERDIPWKVHLIPRTMEEAKKYVTFLVEMYQQLTYLFARTNFLYAYENANGLLLTNKSDLWDILSEQMESGKEQETESFAYVSYTSRTKEEKSNLETNTLPMSGNLTEKLKGMGESLRAGSYQIVVGIDLDGVWNQKEQDEFVAQYQDSLRKRDMYEEGKVYGIFGMVLTILVLFLLFLRTGTPVGTQTSALYLYDKIWLELQVFIGFLLIQTMIWLGRLCSGYSDRILLALYSGAMTVFLFLFCRLILSMIKRMKLKQTGNYSILVLFVQNVLIEKLSLKEFAGELYHRISFASPGKKLWCWLLFEWTLLLYLAVSAVCIYYGEDITVRSYLQSIYGWFAIVWLALFGMILLFWQRKQMQKEIALQNIIMAMRQILQGDFAYVLPEQDLADVLSRELMGMVNQIGGVLENMVDENVRNERMKTELIANVSHDIKTPLTSIINYVDILQGKDIDQEEARRYLQILEQKSLRLKVLMEDLIEASKASSGAIELHMNSIDFRELLCQAGGEFAERFGEENLEMVTELPEHPVYFEGDGRRVFRILENLYGNTAKYAMRNTRVYITLTEDGDHVCFTMKNISSQRLNITAEELMERFVRGDHARTTEGSGLGLSIAKSLTELMGGEFTIQVDGDLFSCMVRFPVLHLEDS
ncbi:MAG: HAMP domain-containing histidine kinase, partial [Lachnospiraceae bacterium]|nr:HAMP domain-containing histidine kinase [Lachnospiraceae bacterium]